MDHGGVVLRTTLRAGVLCQPLPCIHVLGDSTKIIISSSGMWFFIEGRFVAADERCAIK